MPPAPAPRGRRELAPGEKVCRSGKHIYTPGSKKNRLKDRCHECWKASANAHRRRINGRTARPSKGENSAAFGARVRKHSDTLRRKFSLLCSTDTARKIEEAIFAAGEGTCWFNTDLYPPGYCVLQRELDAYGRGRLELILSPRPAGLTAEESYEVGKRVAHLDHHDEERAKGKKSKTRIFQPEDIRAFLCRPCNLGLGGTPYVRQHRRIQEYLDSRPHLPLIERMLEEDREQLPLPFAVA